MSTAVHSSNALREDFDSVPSAASLGLTRIVHEAAVDSTMDIAHALAAQGEAAGAMVMPIVSVRGVGVVVIDGRPRTTADSGSPSSSVRPISASSAC